MSLEHFSLVNGFLQLDGPSKRRGEAHCNKKLCLTATSVEPMARVLLLLSKREDCWFVKLDPQPGAHGMVRGRCFFNNPRAVVEVWKQYKNTGEVLCTIQDDDFVNAFR
ncbi:MAG: hypothetical protein AAF645_19690 [Myxococcota bacterium]